MANHYIVINITFSLRLFTSFPSIRYYVCLQVDNIVFLIAYYLLQSGRITCLLCPVYDNYLCNLIGLFTQNRFERV